MNCFKLIFLIRFELDMLVEVLRSTIKQTELWIEEIKRGSSKPMESYFSG